MDFTIDEHFLIDIITHTRVSLYEGKDGLSEEELLRVLRDEDKVTITEIIDHPEFTRLREQLETEGYIEVEHKWHNGDRVLKPFRLNGFDFDEGCKFPCATALGNAIKCARMSGRTNLFLM